MPTPLSLRLSQNTLDRLAARSRRGALPLRTLAQRYVEEGLRMDEHPGVYFAESPHGRVASLTGTGDVWEVIAAVRANDGDLSETAAYLEIPLGLIQVAVTYYGAFPDEIEREIELNELAAAEGLAAWEAGQAALRA